MDFSATHILLLIPLSIALVFSVIEFCHWVFLRRTIKNGIHDIEEDIHEANRMLGKFSERFRSDEHYWDSIEVCHLEIDRLTQELKDLELKRRLNQNWITTIQTYFGKMSPPRYRQAKQYSNYRVDAKFGNVDVTKHDSLGNKMSD